MSRRTTADAIGFGGKPGKPPTKLKPHPERSVTAGEAPERPGWDDLFRQWESDR